MSSCSPSSSPASLAENSLEKDLILLKREIGVDPGQKIALTDPAPYSELAAETPEEVRAVAYKNRQDYQNLQNQAVEYKAIHAAYRSQRLPTLSFGGYYGVSDVTGVGTHGNFVAQGTLSFPLFREASLRGDADAAQAQLVRRHRSTRRPEQPHRSAGSLRAARRGGRSQACRGGAFKRRLGYPRAKR